MRRAGAKRIGVSKLLAAGAGAVLVLLALAQLILPRIAASRISARVGRYGHVRSVSVSAWPAVELLWGHARSVRVSAGALSLAPSQVGALLWEARGAASMQVSAQSVRIGSLRVTRARLQKHARALSAEGTVSEAAAQAALPAGLRVQLLRSRHGQVEVQATGALFGVRASVHAVAQASAGKLVAHPLGFLVEGLKLTLYSDPHVYVEGVGASVAGRSPRSYRLTMRAQLR
ncbi:MAG TPA: LmeA family phospholipid-binding protein [Solirubrobacteraceae bacterium]|nr:LmeA family phospholipid-binding protein [Solirubrobacteraceae bacterium]